MFRCHWYASSPIIAEHCTTPATALIIYGCGQMHINEIAFCSNHLHQWVVGQDQQPKKCGRCHHKILEYINIDVNSVKNPYTPSNYQAS